MQRKIRVLATIAALGCWAVLAADTTNQTVTIDGQSRGRAFWGIGALSAGASSRLLIDYPEPQRSQVLDFLFKPRFGASLQQLKVEIGGDTQSADGTEPSHACTREEFLHPKLAYYQRGYECWLMGEARQRNRDIYLDILQWGAPGWVGDAREAELRKQGLSDAKIDRAKFFSQDNADFIAAFIKGAKNYHNIDIDCCGIWNERPYEVSWIKLLRKTLDRESLRRVNIVAADTIDDWSIVNDMANDSDLRQAVRAVGVHYPGFNSSAEAKTAGLPLWCSEDGFWARTQDPWQAARFLARLYNRNYVQGRMTKTVVWSLVSSYYDNLTKTIDWSQMQWPYPLVGSQAWTNYAVSCEARIGAGRVARLLVRANRRDPIQGNQGTARLDTVRVQQFGARIKKYKLQSFDGNHWDDVLSRERIRQTQWTDTFAPVETSKLRLVVVAVGGLPP